VIRLDEIVDRIVQQAGENDFLRHPRFHRACRALQHVVGGSKPQPEEILERRTRRHRLELFDVAARVDQQVAGSAAVVPRLDLRLEFGHSRILLGRALLHGNGLIQLFLHVVFECVRLGLGIHGRDGGRTAETRDEGSAIDLHAHLQ
jgi:hypothetical protein